MKPITAENYWPQIQARDHIRATCRCKGRGCHRCDPPECAGDGWFVTRRDGIGATLHCYGCPACARREGSDE